MGTLIQDLRYGLRMLRKNPGFTVVAVITLALGIGANTAIFSVVDAVMLRPLPYREPERLVSIWENRTGQPPSRWSTSGARLGGPSAAAEPSRMSVAPANLMDYRKQNHVFTDMAGFALTGMNLTGSGTPERVWGERVTSNYFSVLGVQPTRGRDFLPEEDTTGNGRVVIVTHELWQQRFGADLHLIGQSLMLDGEKYQVIGIVPPGFQPLSQFGMTEKLNILVPAAYPASMLGNHGDHRVNVVAHLKPGVTLEQARAELEAISNSLAEAYPDSNRNIRAAMAPLVDDVVRDVRTSLMVLLAAVGLILLIACTNVANLLLARSVVGRREISIRFALGATRLRIVRKLLVESTLLGLLGCAAGVLLAAWAKGALVSLAPPGIPRLHSVAVSTRVLGFAAFVSLVTGILSGIFPAWQISKTPPSGSLKAGDRSTAGASVMRWRGSLMVAEIALSVVLLVGAGLLLKSFVLLRGMDLGFQTEHVLGLNINLPETQYPTPERRLAFFEALAAHVGTVPGVESVTFANRMPLRGSWGGGVEVASSSEIVRGESDFQAVSPGYFRTLGIPLLRGRLLTPDDHTGTLPGAVVNTAFVRQFLPNEEPIGRRFRRSPPAPWITIVGIVGDIRREGKAAPIDPQVYFSAAQTDLYPNPVRLADFALRTIGDPRALITAVQKEVWAIDKDQPVTNVRTLDEVVSQSVAQRRFQTLLVLLFAALGLVLALVGVYGVVSYSVSQRTAEIGIRVALGAKRSDILLLVLRQVMLLVTLGATAGLACAYGISRYLQTLLFGIKPSDPLTYAIVALGLSSVALLATYIPARRATKVDPMVALRYE